MKFILEIGTKVVQDIQKAAKQLAKKEPKLYKEASVGVETLNEAADLKTKIEIMETELKALYDKYNPLRAEILASLPGEPVDKVEVLIDGIQIKKFSQVKGSGVLDQERALNLVRNKKLVGKVTKKVTLVDEDALAIAVHTGHISMEEYASCLSAGNVAQVLKIERKFFANNKNEQAV